MTSIVLTRKLSVINIFVFIKSAEESNYEWKQRKVEDKIEEPQLDLTKKKSCQITQENLIVLTRKLSIGNSFFKRNQLRKEFTSGEKLNWMSGKPFDTGKSRQITLMKWQNGGNFSKPNFGAHGGRHLYYRWCRFQSWTRQFSRAFTRIQFFYET